MLRKAKSPIALIMALILCISLFSGIVLAEGFADTSAEKWASIVGSIDDSTGIEAIVPKENVVFIDENLAGYSVGDPVELEYYTSEDADLVYYALTYGENAFGDVAEMKDYITTTLDAQNPGKDFVIVLAAGTYAAADFYAASDALTGSTVTVLGPKAGVAPIDDEFNVNEARDIESGYEAVLTGTMALAVNKDFTIIFDGIALDTDAKFTQADYTAAATRFTVKLNNVYSIASGVAGTFNDDWSVATAGTDHVIFNFAGGNTTTILRDLTVENSYFEFDRLANTSRLEDYTIKNSYFKGTADYSTFYNNIPLPNPCLDGTYDKVATITFEGSRFENIANFWAYGSAVGGTKSAFLRTDLRDEQNATLVTNNAKRGKDGFVVTINGCDFVDMVPGDKYDRAFIRPQGFAGGVMKFVFTNNNFAIKAGTTWAGIVANVANNNEQALINPYASKGTYDIAYVIENNKFIGVTTPFSYNMAGDAKNNANYTADISKNYYADLDGNLFTPSTNYGAVVTGQYVDEAMTEFTGDYYLTGIGGATGLVANAVDVSDAANGNYTGTATVGAVNADAVSATFAGAGITAGVFADEDCENALTSFEGYKFGDVFYVKGVKGTDTVIYTVTVADPYAAIRGELTGDVYAPATDKTFFIDPSNSAVDGVFTYGDGITWGDGKKYSVTAGTNYFTNYADVITFMSSNNGSYNLVFAPGTYNHNLAAWKLTNGTTKVYGPQAGKTPVNNPKKGYTGDAPWTVANNRSANTATEAVFTGFTYNIQTTYHFIVDGVAFNNVQISHARSGSANTWFTMTLHNVYWTMPNGKAFLNLTGSSATAASQNLCVRHVKIYDAYIDYTAATTISAGNASADDIIMDGLYVKMSADMYATGTVPNDSFINHYFADHRYQRDGYSILSITNSRFENLPTRGLINSLQEAVYNSAARPAGTAMYVFDNNDFINLGYKVNAGFPTVIRIKAAGPDIYTLQFTNNYIQNGSDEICAPIDVFKGYDHTLSLKTARVENNVVIGHDRALAHYDNADYAEGSEIDNSYNYFGSVDGTLLQPIGTGALFNGLYLDKACTVHSSEMDVELAADLEGGVVTYPNASINVILPMDKTFTAASLVAKEGATVTLYNDKALSDELASVAPSATEIQNIYAKVAKSGYYVTYPVTVMPDAPDYTGEKIFFDPAVAGLDAGTLVAREIDGEAYLLEVGKNITADLNDEIFPEDANEVTQVYLCAKEYTGFSVPTKYAIYGAKAGINPNDATDITKANALRADDAGETIITGTITIPQNSADITIDGLTFTGAGKFAMSGGGETHECHAVIKNCRNSLAEDAYADAQPEIAFFHMVTGGYKYIDLLNNRFVDVQIKNVGTAFAVIRSWMGTASGNYICNVGSNNQTIFWLNGEYINQDTRSHYYDATITNNYFRGRLTTSFSNANYDSFKVKITNNTFEAGFANKSIMNLNVASTKLAKSNIEISGNTVINPNNLTGIGFLWFVGTANEENLTEYNKANVKVTDNNINLGESFGYVFGVESANPDALVITATGNTIANVKATSVGADVGNSLFNSAATVKHFDLGTGENATVVNGHAVDVMAGDAAFKVPASAIDTANKVITVAVDDKESAFNLLTTDGSNIVVLDEEGNATSLHAALAAADGVTEYKVALASYDGTFDPANTYTVKVVKGLAKVALDAEKTVASKEDGKETWKTYWEANIDVVDEFGNTIGTNDFKAIDYGMIYAVDQAELDKLAADENYQTNKAIKYSYAGADAEGLEKVFKNYSFRFTGIAEGKYRYGKFYVTYELNGKTVTTFSDAKELYTGVISD